MGSTVVARQHGSAGEALQEMRRLQAAGETEAAEQLLASARIAWPGNPAFVEEQAALALKRGRHDQASAMSRAVLASHPGRGRAALLLVQALSHGKDPAGALQAIEEHAAWPWTPTLFELALTCRRRLGQHAEALTDAQRWLATQDDSAFLRSMLGRLLARDEKAFALALARLGCQRWPDDAAMQLRGGQIAMINGTWKVASGWLARVCELEPGEVEHHVRLANVEHFQTGDFAAAVRAAERAFAIDPGQIGMRLLAANHYFVQGEHARALQSAMPAFDHPSATIEQRWMLASLIGACDPPADMQARIRAFVDADAGGTGTAPPFVFTAHGVQVLIPAGAKSVVYYFSGINTDWGLTFGELRALLQPAGVGLVFLQDYERLYFLKGLAALANDFEGTVAALARLLPAPAPRVLCMGVSAGGYSALHYGLALHADRMLLFAPPTDVSKENVRVSDARSKVGYRRAVNTVPGMLIDIRPRLLQELGRGRIDIWFGADMPHDNKHARHLEGIENVHLHPVAGLGLHDVVSHLRANGQFDSIVRDWLVAED